MTYGFGSSGIVAQSIGGGGGTGGDATNSDGAIVNMVVGGTGGSGGERGGCLRRPTWATARVTTLERPAQGVVMQSIGGGGGAGGAGYGTSSVGLLRRLDQRRRRRRLGRHRRHGQRGPGQQQYRQHPDLGGRELRHPRAVDRRRRRLGGASTAKSIVESGGDFPGMSLALVDGRQRRRRRLGIGGLPPELGPHRDTRQWRRRHDRPGDRRRRRHRRRRRRRVERLGGGFDFSASVTHGGNGGGAGNGSDVTAINNGLIITRRRVGRRHAGPVDRRRRRRRRRGRRALPRPARQKSLSVEIGLGGRRPAAARATTSRRPTTARS